MSAMLVATLSAIFLFAGLPAEGKRKSGATSAKSTSASTGKSGKTSGKVRSSFSHPNFAYPKNVIADADKELAAAKKSGNYADQLRALMQMTIAGNSISLDSIGERLQLIHNTSAAMPEPYRSVGYVLEAYVYCELYDSNSYTYSKRNLPLSSYPDDPQEWSEDLFIQKICELISQATASLSSAADTKIEVLSPIITNRGRGTSEFSTVADFLAYQSIEILSTFTGRETNIIPFGAKNKPATPSEVAARLLKEISTRIIDIDVAKGNYDTAVWFIANYSHTLSKDEAEAYIEEWYKRLADNPASLYLLLQLIPNEDGVTAEVESKARQKYYSTLEEALKRFPESRFAPMIKNALTSMNRPEIKFYYQGQYLSDRDLKIEVTLTNTEEAYALLYSLPERTSYFSQSEVLKTGKFLGAYRVNASGAYPYSRTDTLTIPNPGYGLYTLLPSTTANEKGTISTFQNSIFDTFRVSDIMPILIGDNIDKAGTTLYVADAISLRPLENVTVEMTPKNSYKNEKAVRLTTDSNGGVKFPLSYAEVVITNGKDILPFDCSNYQTGSKPIGTRSIRLLTDLSLYHPGDTVGVAGVLYQTTPEYELNFVPGESVTLLLQNTNYQVVDSLRCTTDSFGRFSGCLVIPKEGLLGTWCVVAEHGEENRHIGVESINVAEYVAPTFYVAIDSERSSYKAGETIRIEGEVMTYSGMPVASASIDYKISYSPSLERSYGRRNISSASYSSTVDCDNSGKFVIELPTAELEGTPFSLGCYHLDVTAVSPTGEAQSAPRVSFTLGDTDYIYIYELKKQYIVKDEQLNLSIQVMNALFLPVKREVSYTLTNDKGVSIAGTFTSPTLTLDISELPSGVYKLSLSLPEDKATTETAEFILSRVGDETPPVETPLWVPESTFYGETGKSVPVNFGSYYRDNYILSITSDVNGIIDRRWLKTTGKMMSQQVTAPAENNRIWVELFGCHDLNIANEKIQIIPESVLKKLQVETVSFRDQLVPGEEEKWTFRFLLDGNPAGDIPVMAVMTDKSLDAISPFEWSLNFSDVIRFSPAMRSELFRAYSRDPNFSLSRGKWFEYKDFVLPYWQTYNYPFVGGYYGTRNMVMYKSAPTAAAAGVNDMAESYELSSADFDYDDPCSAYAWKAEAISEEESGFANGNNSAENIPMNDFEHPLAFFSPELTTDASGNVELSFTVPQFSTTWKLQLAGYTPDKYANVSEFTAVSSRPIMVKGHLPRFVRTGDRVLFTATLMNNRDVPLPVGGRIEIFNPSTSEVLANKEFPATEFAPMASAVVGEEFDVPYDLDMLGVRYYAFGAGHSDGEQSAIVVLPSSSPVIESTQFYLSAGVPEVSVTLPEFRADDNITLQYCDNPVWYCITALPDLVSDNSSDLLSKLNVLFGNAVGGEIAKDHPEVGEAIRYWTEGKASGADDTLISNLEKDASLKNVALVNTPWVNNAASETLRMERLTSILDYTAVSSSVLSLMNDLRLEQKNDGGWSWVPEMKSSLFVTESVLSTVGKLLKMDAIPGTSVSEPSLRMGVKYCDKALYDAYVKAKKKVDVYNALNWLYIRSFYDYKPSTEFSQYKTKALNEIAASWSRMGIYDKATAAIVLARNGKRSEAQKVLESLRQYAVYSPSTGMYFDNLAAGFSPYNRLITTTQVLNAFAEILPEDASVDQLRQWLILQRRTEDWGRSRSSAEVVAAILTSGIKWTTENDAAAIYLDDKNLDTSSARFTGYLSSTLTPETASGKTLRVERTSTGPAWGGVIAQYVAPSASVKAEDCERLSITKDVYTIDYENNGIAVEGQPLKLGDKVRVTLTINNSVDLEYVAITDERGACLEPVNQLSSYTLIDGIYAYRETRNSQTNILIDYLPKGTHRIVYDCYLSQEGEFTVGIATAQSLYAPSVVAHSSGEIMVVTNK